MTIAIKDDLIKNQGYHLDYIYGTPKKGSGKVGPVEAMENYRAELIEEKTIIRLKKERRKER